MLKTIKTLGDKRVREQTQFFLYTAIGVWQAYIETNLIYKLEFKRRKLSSGIAKNDLKKLEQK